MRNCLENLLQITCVICLEVVVTVSRPTKVNVGIVIVVPQTILLPRGTRILRGNTIHIFIEGSSGVRGIGISKHANGIHFGILIFQSFRRINSGTGNIPLKSIRCRWLSIGKHNNNRGTVLFCVLTTVQNPISFFHAKIRSCSSTRSQSIYSVL